MIKRHLESRTEEEIKYAEQLNERTELAGQNAKNFTMLQVLHEEGKLSEVQVARQTQYLLDQEAQLDSIKDNQSEELSSQQLDSDYEEEDVSNKGDKKLEEIKQKQVKFDQKDPVIINQESFRRMTKPTIDSNDKEYPDEQRTKEIPR